MVLNADYMIYYILTIVLSVIGMIVSARLKSKFNHYSQIGLRSNKSGAEIAQEMLRYYGIHNV
jgi:uncharacterized protein